VLALLIWGFALYGIYVALWKLVRVSIRRRERQVPVTAILIVKEGASYIEGILRALTTAEPFVGRELHVVVIDCGSRDETVRIVEGIASKRGTVSLLRVEQEPLPAIGSVITGKSKSVQLLFDLRGNKVSPFDVVPTLAAFWSDQPAWASS